MSSFRQWKIFNKVFAPDYKDQRAKSYGSNSYTDTKIVIGTSKTNSFNFINHKTMTYSNSKNELVFEFWVNNRLIKQSIYDPKKKKIISEKLLVNDLENHLKEIKESLGVNTDNKTMNLIDSKIEETRQGLE